MNQMPEIIKAIPITSRVLMVSLKTTQPIHKMNNMDTPLQIQFTIPMLLNW